MVVNCAVSLVLLAYCCCAKRDRQLSRVDPPLLLCIPCHAASCYTHACAIVPHLAPCSAMHARVETCSMRHAMRCGAMLKHGACTMRVPKNTRMQQNAKHAPCMLPATCNTPMLKRALQRHAVTHIHMLKRATCSHACALKPEKHPDTALTHTHAEIRSRGRGRYPGVCPLVPDVWDCATSATRAT